MDKKILGIISAVVAVLLLFPLCCLSIVVLSGFSHMISENYVWTGTDTGALTLYTLAFCCNLLFVFLFLGGAAWAFYYKKK